MNLFSVIYDYMHMLCAVLVTVELLLRTDLKAIEKLDIVCQAFIKDLTLSFFISTAIFCDLRALPDGL